MNEHYQILLPVNCCIFRHNEETRTVSVAWPVDVSILRRNHASCSAWTIAWVCLCRASQHVIHVRLLFLTMCVPCDGARWYNTCPVGGCHRIYTPHICQRLRILHDHGICTLLANGLPQHWRRDQDGHRTVQGSNTRTLHGQVSPTIVVHNTACIAYPHVENCALSFMHLLNSLKNI